MIPASGGSAFVDGRSIGADMRHIRKSLGVCPQFDILWPTITVREHLEIFAAIKGFPAAKRTSAAEEAAEEVGELSCLCLRLREAACTRAHSVAQDQCV